MDWVGLLLEVVAIVSIWGVVSLDKGGLSMWEVIAQDSWSGMELGKTCKVEPTLFSETKWKCVLMKGITSRLENDFLVSKP